MALHDVMLLLGSNIDAAANMRRAREELAGRFEIAALSSLIESAPVGMPPGAPDFLNQVVQVRTDLPFAALAGALEDLERRLGRTPDQRGFRSRVIDIDILLYNDLVEKSDGREVPHPDILVHYYVAFLLAEICPNLRHPVTGRAMRALAAGLMPTPIHIREQRRRS